MTTLLGLKVALFAGLLAWWLVRDRVDYRPVLSPPPWRVFLPVAILVLAAAEAAFTATVPATVLALCGLAVLGSYPLGERRLSPVGIESSGGRTLRWEDVHGVRSCRGGVELVARDGSRLFLPRDFDGMVTFARVAQVALPPDVLRRPSVQQALLGLIEPVRQFDQYRKPEAIVQL